MQHFPPLSPLEIGSLLSQISPAPGSKLRRISETTMPERDYSHQTPSERLNIKDDAYPFLPHQLQPLRHFGRGPLRLIVARHSRSGHRSSPFDKSIAALNRCFGFQSIAVLHIGATPGNELPFAFGEKLDATQTSDATQTAEGSSAPITTSGPRRSFLNRPRRREAAGVIAEKNPSQDGHHKRATIAAPR
jgi:hypothetical protein